jgi:hypothetical protein
MLSAQLSGESGHGVSESLAATAAVAVVEPRCRHGALLTKVSPSHKVSLATAHMPWTYRPSPRRRAGGVVLLIRFDLS